MNDCQSQVQHSKYYIALFLDSYMTCCVSSGTLNPDLSITYSTQHCTSIAWCHLSSYQVCDEVRIRIRQRSNFERFQQIQNSTKFLSESTNVLSALLSNANSWKILVSRLISYGMHTQPDSADRLFLKFYLSHKLQLLKVKQKFCSVMCWIVLISNQILLTLGNNIVTLLFNWLKPVH